jgi:hypothetical protein
MASESTYKEAIANHIEDNLVMVQEPVAYDKTELNCFAQDLYNQKMREGKRGHYESMFHVIHQCVKKVASPSPQRTWVGLTDEERYEICMQCARNMGANFQDTLCKAIEDALRKKNR